MKNLEKLLIIGFLIVSSIIISGCSDEEFIFLTKQNNSGCPFGAWCEEHLYTNSTVYLDYLYTNDTVRIEYA